MSDDDTNQQNNLNACDVVGNEETHVTSDVDSDEETHYTVENETIRLEYIPVTVEIFYDRSKYDNYIVFNNMILCLEKNDKKLSLIDVNDYNISELSFDTKNRVGGCDRYGY